MLNLSVILEESAKRYPAKTAFTFLDNAYSFSDVNELANKVANGLASLGIGVGDKVALTCPNLPAFPMIYYGVLKAGAVVVPLSVLLKKEEIEYHLRDSDAKAYFCFTGTPELPMGEMGYQAFKAVDECRHFFMITPKAGMPTPVPDVQTFDSFLQDLSPQYETCQSSADDTCVIIYTSGTTGQPKGAELTHSNLFLNASLISETLALTNHDVLLTVLPLFHIFGMTVMMNAGVYRASKQVLLPRFEPELAFAAMQKHKVTVFAGVPTMYWGLLHYSDPKFDYGSIAKTLRICCSGGASLPVKLLEDFEQRFNVVILEGYGMSEGSPVVTFSHLEFGRKPGSIGKPFWGVDVKLIDSNGAEVPTGEKGELLYRGHNVMKGYYKKPDETTRALRNGWLYSGDVAVKDADGFFFIVDRTKDMIARGGFKVYPREVEEMMIKHEAVSLVAVIGVPDDELGEEVKAFVVLKEGQTLAAADLVAWTKERVAAYKYPRFIEFVSSLPMSATGKILKKELRLKKETDNTLATSSVPADASV